MSKEIKKREPCPVCLAAKGTVSRNNLAVYADGKYCNACGYSEGTKLSTELLPGSLIEIPSRGLTLDTCTKFNIRVTSFSGTLSGEKVQKHLVTIFPYYDKGKIVRQKIRSQTDKKLMTQRGNTACGSLFGENLFQGNPKIPILITFGEYDAAAAFQMSGLPSVSITKGDKYAFTEIANKVEYLSQFKEVILIPDQDKSCLDAVDQCLPLFEPGRVKVAALSFNDPNEMLLANKAEEFKRCLWNAKVERPSTIVFPDEIKEKILKKPEFGLSWPYEFMTTVTYGNRLGEVYILAGAESAGKTEFMYKIVAHHISHGYRVGLIDLERQPEATMQRLISSVINKRVYLPDCIDWNKEQIKEYVEKYKDSVSLYRWESGQLTLTNILINIRYLAKAFKINFFVIDNLTALSVSCSDNKPDYVFASDAVGELVQLAKELNVTIFIVNHLSKSPVQLLANIDTEEDHEYNTNKSGLTWASGRIPDSEHIYGGGKVVKLADYVMVIARNRLSDDDVVRRTTVIKFLKTRFESSHEGEEFRLLYDRATGKLNEIKER